jgi:hypothetical protein
MQKLSFLYCPEIFSVMAEKGKARECVDSLVMLAEWQN